MPQGSFTALTETIYYILLAFIEPNHGYGVIGLVNEMTDGRIELGAGTLYGAINNLLDKGYICLISADKSSRKKKEYQITPLGMEALNSEYQRLKELLNNGLTYSKGVISDEKI